MLYFQILQSSSFSHSVSNMKELCALASIVLPASEQVYQCGAVGGFARMASDILNDCLWYQEKPL